MRILGRLLGATLLATQPALLFASLTWTTTSFEGTSSPLQKTFDVAFTFRNSGSTPVTIRDIQTNCDCLIASADRQSYEPGQAGLVVARFAIGERTGAYERSVTVTTDGGAAPQRLRVRIDVPELASVQPKVRDWSAGSASAEQAVDIVVADAVRIEFSELFVSSDSFQARLETIEPGRRYRVFIRPTATAESANAAIRVKGTAATGEAVVVSAYANVR